MDKNVPFADLNLQYLNLKNEIDNAISLVIKKSAFIRGPFVEEFESNFAKLVERKHCISCANGTDALFIAMKALDIKNDDEVIVPAHSWISTSETVSMAGGKVVFCDTEKDSYNIDPNLIEEKITSKTVGIIPVHLFGQPSDMDEIVSIANKHKLWIIEDCAQAHLATYKGKQVGSFGHISTFSFYPGKNLGAMGDAGALVTDNNDIALKVTKIARHGGLKKGQHDIEGINSRMDGLQAAILSVKLKHLKNWTEIRSDLASNYLHLLKDVKSINSPKVKKQRTHVWHLFVIRHEKRNNLSTFLKENNIGHVINYPIALPFLEAYKKFKHKPADFSNAFYNQNRIISIPLFPEMTQAQQLYVISTLKKFEE